MISPSVSLIGLNGEQCFIYGVLRFLLDSVGAPITIKDTDLPAIFYHSELACVVALKRLDKLGFIAVSFNSGFTVISKASQQEEAA